MNVGGVGGARGYDRVGDNEGVEQAQEAEAPALPRSGWQDKGALSKAIDRTLSKVAAGASRPNHRTKWVAAKRAGGGARAERTERTEIPTHVAIAIGRGGKTSAAKGPSKPSKPVIAAKYGLPPGGKPDVKPDKPVIAAKYGLPPGGKPDVKPDKPVIAAKYGLPPGGKPGTGPDVRPDKPVIAAKYGLAPGGKDDGPDKPVIAAKYGLPPARR